jgi:transposase InsO family protein
LRDSHDSSVIELNLELFVCLNSPDEDAANPPAVYPETVLIDHGKVYKSDAFFRICRTPGTNVQFARLAAPTDESPLERVFGIIRHHFLSLLRGYTGSDIASRGSDTEKDTFYLINEIEEMFGEWVATYWQRRAHGGLHLPDQLEMSFPRTRCTPRA